MPNHVDHDMVVSGPAADLEKFEGGLKDANKILDANRFIPYPKEFADADAEHTRVEKEQGWEAACQIKDGFNNGGYEWCCQHWGTKWGIYKAVRLSKLPSKFRKPKTGYLAFTFQSAWSPASAIILAMSEQFPTLKFEVRFYERGMGFQGHDVYEGGDCISTKEGDYDGRRGG